MYARTIFAVSMVLFLTLLGCDGNTGPPARNAIMRADQERAQVIAQTRAASYSVFSDTDDVLKLKDPTFIDALHHAESPNGSAFGVRADGLVLTNAHVINGAFCTGPMNRAPKNVEDALRESGRQHEEDSRRTNKSPTYCVLATQAFTKAFRAKLIALDQVNDIALLCLRARSPVPYLQMATAREYSEGTEVLTIGAPYGHANMLTLGYISNLDHFLSDETTKGQGVRKIQLSAAMLPGNSGGPLVSVATGHVVGQVVAIWLQNGIPTPMSYANPVEHLEQNIAHAPPCAKE